MRGTLTGRVTVLAAIVSLLVTALVATGVVAIVTLRHAEQRESHAKDVAVATLLLRAAAADEESALRGYALSTSARFLVLFRSAHGRIVHEAATLHALVAGDQIQTERVERVAAQLESYNRDYAQNVIVITQIAPNVVRGRAANSEDKRRTSEIRATLGAILASEDRRAAEASTHARSVARVAIVVGVAAVIVAAALVCAFGIWVAHAIARPLRRVASAAAEVAAGDFTVRLPAGGVGEAGALVAAFNAMTRELDIGQRQLLAQNAQLVESERHKRELISMVSHELRTPLAAVVGFTTLLLQREFPADEQRRYLGIVDAQARRLAALAADFLDVQLLDAGTMTLVVSPFDLVELVVEQAQLFFLHPATARLDLSIPKGPIIVQGDRDRLAQVLGNLLSNALKYSADDAPVHVAVADGAREASVTVADEGVGIAPADRARIFEKFFRSQDAAATVGGTGVGLSIAQEIAAAHGGRIDVDSTPGAGTAFRLVIPKDGGGA